MTNPESWMVWLFGKINDSAAIFARKVGNGSAKENPVTLEMNYGPTRQTHFKLHSNFKM